MTADTLTPAAQTPTVAALPIDAPQAPATPAGRGGAPVGNSNARRRRGLRVASYGKGCEYQRRANGHDSELNRAAAVAVHGEPIPFAVEVRLRRATEENLRAKVLAKWIASGKDSKGDALSPADLAAMVEAQGRAFEQRDKALQQAGLLNIKVTEPGDLWASLYDKPTPTSPASERTAPEVTPKPSTPTSGPQCPSGESVGMAPELVPDDWEVNPSASTEATP